MNISKKQKQSEIKADVVSNKTARKLILKEISTFLATLLIVSSIVLVVNVTAPKKNTDSNEMTEVTTTYTTTTIPETVTTTNTKKTTRKTTTTATSVTTTTSSTSTCVTTSNTVTTVDTTIPNTEETIVVTETSPVCNEETVQTTEPVPVPSETVTETEPVIEITQPEETESPSVPEETTPVNVQWYYGDDGDYGWTYFQYRYSIPDYSIDSQKYHLANEYVTENERILLCNIVASEYGSDYVSIAEKAKVVAVVMNRLNNGYWGSTIESVLSAPYQFSGFWIQYSFIGSVTPTCIDAVDYYFAHSSEPQYQGIMYISGGGGWNSFS